MYNLPITILKKPLLKYLFATTLALCCLFYAEVSFGQEYYDATNSPRQYYYNNLESGTVGTTNPETYFPNSVSTQANTAINLVSNSSLNGTKSFSTTGSSSVGSIAWNFMKNSLSAANTNLTSASWEWEFDYKNVANAAPNEDPTAATIASGSNAWRYWLIAGTSKLGIYVTQTAAGKLEGRERFNTASNGYRVIWTVDMPINKDTYQIRIEKSVIGYYNVFVYDRTTNTTKSSLAINAAYNDGVDLNYYNLSYLEVSSTTADRFQFDNFNFYQVRLDYLPVSDNGISSPIYPGMGTAIIYGVDVCVRGDIAMGRFALKYTSGTEKLFGDNPTASLYTTSTLPFSTTGLTAYKSITMNNGGSSQYVDLPPLTYYSSGSTDGTTSHVDYYFFTIGVLSTFQSGYPTSVSYSVSNSNNDTYSDFFRSVSPYSSNSNSSVSQPSSNGDVWDWQGSSTSWNSSGNKSWLKNGSKTTGNATPGATSDIVRLGLSQYLEGNSQPQLPSDLTIAQLIIGNLGANSTSTNPVTLDLAGHKLTVSNSIKVNANATLKLANTSTTDGTLAISGASTIASTASVTWPTTNKASIDNSGTLTLKSDASGTGSIGSLVNASGTKTGTVKGSGTFSVERYFTGGSANSRGYRLLSSPVSASSSNLYIPNLSYINLGSFTTGKGGTGKGFSTNSIAGPTIYFYRENIAPNNSSFTNGNFRGVSDISQSATFTLENETGTFKLPAGNGFMFYFRGGKTTSSPYVTAVTSQTATLTSTGYLNQGDITVSNWFTPSSTYLSYTNSGAIANSAIRGYNLVGNPYPSSIDWDLVYTSNNPTDDATGIDKTIYVYNPIKKTYATYKAGKAGVGTNFNQATNNNIIPSGQGFFVIAHSATNTLTFHELNKSTTQVTSSGLSLATAANNDAAALKYMRVELFKDSLNSEEALVFFDAKSKPAYNLEEDAKYLKGSGVVNFSTQSSDNIALAINQTAFPQKSQVIPLNVNVTTSGTYQLKLTELKNIPAVYNVWLMDNYKKDSLDIKSNPVYSFNANTADTNSYKGQRFSLMIRQNPALAVHLLNFDATKSTSNVKINWTVENEANYTTYVVQRSTDGGKSYKIIDSLTSAGLGNYTDLDQSPILGDNYYRLMQIDIAGGVSYSNVVKVMYANTAANSIIANSNISVYPNPAQSVLNLAVTNSNASQNTIAKAGSYKITITSSTGSLVKTETTASASWQGQINNLLPGTYFIQVINTKDNTLTGKSTFVKL